MIAPFTLPSIKQIPIIKPALPSQLATMTELLLHLVTPFFFLFPLLFFFFFLTPKKNHNKVEALSSTTTTTLPKAYPLIGSYFAFKANTHRRIQWLSDAVLAAPNATFTFHRLLGQETVVTANPAAVQHILKNHFSNYQKGGTFVTTLSDFLGAGIFNANGENWKFQRQVASHEFNTKSLRKFVEQVVDAELNHRLIPILNESQSQSKTLDFQDILQRFGFDSICKIAFGFDPEYLTPALTESNLAKAFEEANMISSKRFREPLPVIWKIKRKLNIGSEKRLRIAVSAVHEFAKKIVREKKKELEEKASLDSVDMLSRFLSSGHSDEDFVMDIVISFILAGKDTTSAALTWFFWLLSKHPRVENEIIKEIREKSEAVTVYDEVKDMVYTHAALCESMRLYPPVPMNSREAVNNDALPDGTTVKKGISVTYHVYAMGRMESIWGSDWAEFRPERWLERVESPSGESSLVKWRFVGKDSFSYPVFHAGPRICLGKEMAFLQMKRVVASVLKQFRVVPVVVKGVEPEFISYLTSQMKGGFPVKIKERFD